MVILNETPASNLNSSIKNILIRYISNLLQYKYGTHMVKNGNTEILKAFVF